MPAVRYSRLACLAWAVLLAPSAALAQQPSASTPAPAAQPDPVFAAAQKVFEAIPEAERRAIQEDLVWASDFRGGTSGAFGPLTFKAITGLQKAAGAPADGIMSPGLRAAIGQTAAKARSFARFSVLADGRTGVRIGVPQKLLERTQAGRTGTRWTSADGAAVLETAVEQTLPLQALFDRFTAPAPGRKVTYKVLRPDWFVVTAESGGQRSYIRFATAGAALRGFAFSYPVAGGPELDRLAVAIANSFDPAPAPGASAAGPQAAAPAPPAPVARPAGGQSGWLAATALLVAPGRAVTTASVETCPDLAAGRQPARLVKVDRAAGLALLEVGAKGRAASLPAAAPADGADLVVLGYTAASGEPPLSLAPGEARVPAGQGQTRVFAPLQRGVAGSAVLDRSGALVGLVSGSAPEPRLVAGIVPQASWPVVPAAAVAAFLAGAGVAAAPPAAPDGERTAGDIAGALKGSLLPVTCAR